MHVYKMFHHMLLITNMLLYESLKNTTICHTEYQEALNVTINVLNTEQFHLLLQFTVS